MTLIQRLVRAAELWAAVNERSLARLATIVVNDGKLFERIGAGGSCTVATYERLTAYLRDPGNWSGEMPAEACRLLGHWGSNSVADAGSASGTTSEVSGLEHAA